MKVQALIYCAALTLAGLLSPRALALDKVILVTGDIFYGELLRNDREEVAIKLENGGILYFRASMVREARKSKTEIDSRFDPDSFLSDSSGEAVPQKEQKDYQPLEFPEDGTLEDADPAVAFYEEGDDGEASGDFPDEPETVLEGLDDVGELLPPQVISRPEIFHHDALTSENPNDPAAAPDSDALDHSEVVDEIRNVDPFSGDVESPAHDSPGGEVEEIRPDHGIAEIRPDDFTYPPASTRWGPVEKAPGRGYVLIDDEHHFRITPPPGFVKIEAAPGIVRHYREPLTQANFIVTAYLTTEPLIELKKKVTRSYTGRFNSFMIQQDISYPGKSFEAWLVEMRTTLGKLAVHRQQLFVRSHDEILIFSYSVPENFWNQLQGDFSNSLSSLKILGMDSTATGKLAERGTLSVPE